MLAEPEEDGLPLLDHLLALERQSGIRPQILLDAPTLPEGCDELWGIFNELHSCRDWIIGGVGSAIPKRITYGDIDAFQRVSGMTLQPWERAAITGADRAFRDRKAEQASGSQT